MGRRAIDEIRPRLILEVPQHTRFKQGRIGRGHDQPRQQTLFDTRWRAAMLEERASQTDLILRLLDMED